MVGRPNTSHPKPRKAVSKIGLLVKPNMQISFFYTAAGNGPCLDVADINAPTECAGGRIILQVIPQPLPFFRASNPLSHGLVSGVGGGNNPIELMRSMSVWPLSVIMYGMNTASNDRMPVSTAITCPLTQSRRIELTAIRPCLSAA